MTLFNKKATSKRTSLRLLLALMLTLTLCGNGCATVSSEAPTAQSVPPWPVAGAAVADELDRVCPARTCPAIDGWIARLEKHKQQLEANK